MQLGLVYAVTAVATNLRHQLFMDEILLAVGDSSNEALNQVQALINQKLIIPTDGGGYQVRHRYIADRAVEYFKTNNQLGEPMRGLLFAIASKVHSRGKPQVEGVAALHPTAESRRAHASRA